MDRVALRDVQVGGACRTETDEVAGGAGVKQNGRARLPYSTHDYKSWLVEFLQRIDKILWEALGCAFEIRPRKIRMVRS